VVRCDQLVLHGWIRYSFWGELLVPRIECGRRESWMIKVGLIVNSCCYIDLSANGGGSLSAVTSRDKLKGYKAQCELGSL